MEPGVPMDDSYGLLFLIFIVVIVLGGAWELIGYLRGLDWKHEGPKVIRDPYLELERQYYEGLEKEAKEKEATEKEAKD
jgi:hypothetical protein